MTDPIWLYLKDGTKTEKVACGKCRIIASSEEAARACCAPRLCSVCGEKVPTADCWTTCSACRQEIAHKLRAKTFADARNVDACDWGGAVVYKDSDYSSVDELVDFFDDTNIEESPEYVWGTRTHGIDLDAHTILNWATEEMYEGAIDHIDINAVVDLQELLDKWVKQHGPPPGWIEDRGIAIVNIPWCCAEES